MADNPISPCPQSPNCVSSAGAPSNKKLRPIPFKTTASEAQARLRSILEDMGGEIAQERKRYIHALFRSKIFGFVDDVELWLDEHNRVIHFKSASRTGWYDFGVNRKRVEAIRTAFVQGE